MPKIYFPIRSLDVAASPPHGTDVSYRVSYGLEHWQDHSEPCYVYKVQMAYGGIVAGRKTPSYPAGSDDLERVCEAFLKLLAAASQARTN